MRCRNFKVQLVLRSCKENSVEVWRYRIGNFEEAGFQKAEAKDEKLEKVEKEDEKVKAVQRTKCIRTLWVGSKRKVRECKAWSRFAL